MDRRQLLKSTLAVAGTAVTTSAIGGSAIAEVCSLTPKQTEGPFYPVKNQADKDSDLTYISGGSLQADGERIFVSGIVTDQNCQPVKGALVEIWQACQSGRYNHPQDPNPAPLDPNFQYWGKALTNSSGEYLFKTIIPGAYPADVNWVRPPHIHFKITKLGFHELTTQMYFDGHPLNPSDRILQSLALADQKKVSVPLIATSDGLRVANFNISIRKA